MTCTEPVSKGADSNMTLATTSEPHHVRIARVELRLHSLNIAIPKTLLREDGEIHFVSEAEMGLELQNTVKCDPVRTANLFR